MQAFLQRAATLGVAVLATVVLASIARGGDPTDMPLIMRVQRGEDAYNDAGGEYGYGESDYGSQTARPAASTIEPVALIPALPAPGLGSKAVVLGRFSIVTQTRQVTRRVPVEPPVVEEPPSEETSEASPESESSDEGGGYESSDGGYSSGGEPSDDGGYYDDYESESGPRMETITETVTEQIPWKLTLLATGAPRFQKRQTTATNRTSGYGDGSYGESDYDYGSDSDDYRASESGERRAAVSGDDTHVATFSDFFELRSVTTPTGETAWRIFTKGPGRDVEVAQLGRTSAGVLMFRWTVDATPSHAETFAYHVLVVETGKETEPIGFAQVREAAPLRVNCLQKRGECSFTLPGLPKDAALCLQITAINGFTEIFSEPRGAVPMGTPIVVSVGGEGGGDKTVILQFHLKQNAGGAVAVEAVVANAVAEAFNYFLSAGVGSDRLPVVRENMSKRIAELTEQAEKVPAAVKTRLLQEAESFRKRSSYIGVIQAVHNVPGISYRVFVEIGGYGVPIAAYDAPPLAAPEPAATRPGR